MAIPCCGGCCETVCLFVFCCNKAHGDKRNDQLAFEEADEKRRKEEADKKAHQPAVVTNEAAVV